jgi:hypothetical protein
MPKKKTEKSDPQGEAGEDKRARSLTDIDPPQPPRRGRPPHAKSEERGDVVAMMAAGGIPQKNIAQALGIDENTLRKHYADELDSAKDLLDAEVVGQLVKKIRQGDTASIIFYLKTRCGWKGRQVVEVGKALHEEALNDLE